MGLCFPTIPFQNAEESFLAIVFRILKSRITYAIVIISNGWMDSSW